MSETVHEPPELPADDDELEPADGTVPEGEAEPAAGGGQEEDGS